MKNLTTVIPLLQGLASQTGAAYQLRKPDGSIVFSSDDNRPSAAVDTDLQEISRRLSEGEKLGYASNGKGTYTCGASMNGGNGAVGYLMCYGRLPKINSSASNGSSPSVHARETEAFLAALVDILQENRVAREEVWEMAEALDQSFEDLNLYAQIATQIKTLRFSTQMLQNLVAHLLENMLADMAFAIMVDRQQNDVQIIRPGAGHIPANTNTFIQALLAAVSGKCLASGQNYFILNDSREAPHFQSLTEAPYRFLSVPIHHDHHLYGRIGLVSFNMKQIFRQGELKMLVSMAEQLAIVIANTDLYYDLEQSVINMVKSMVIAIEAKDIYTRGHSERVSQYSLMMGRRLNLDETSYRELKWASVLHDIGKIGIPGSILNKPGRLTDEEFDIIKKHPGKGGEIIGPVSQIAASLPGIVHHHERYDGKGYPDGLKGETIPLMARIIAVADTFDAITSTRAYREGAPDAKALAIIDDCAGSQLDPQMVAIFKEVYSNHINPGKEDQHGD